MFGASLSLRAGQRNPDYSDPSCELPETPAESFTFEGTIISLDQYDRIMEEGRLQDFVASCVEHFLPDVTEEQKERIFERFQLFFLGVIRIFLLYHEWGKHSTVDLVHHVGPHNQFFSEGLRLWIQLLQGPLSFSQMQDSPHQAIVRSLIMGAVEVATSPTEKPTMVWRVNGAEIAEEHLGYFQEPDARQALERALNFMRRIGPGLGENSTFEVELGQVGGHDREETHDPNRRTVLINLNRGPAEWWHAFFHALDIQYLPELVAQQRIDAVDGVVAYYFRIRHLYEMNKNIFLTLSTLFSGPFEGYSNDIETEFLVRIFGENRNEGNYPIMSDEEWRRFAGQVGISGLPTPGPVSSNVNFFMVVRHFENMQRFIGTLSQKDHEVVDTFVQLRIHQLLHMSLGPHHVKLFGVDTDVLPFFSSTHLPHQTPFSQKELLEATSANRFRYRMTRTGELALWAMLLGKFSTTDLETRILRWVGDSQKEFLESFLITHVVDENNFGIPDLYKFAHHIVLLGLNDQMAKHFVEGSSFKEFVCPVIFSIVEIMEYGSEERRTQFIQAVTALLQHGLEVRENEALQIFDSAIGKAKEIVFKPDIESLMNGNFPFDGNSTYSKLDAFHAMIYKSLQDFSRRV